MLGCSMQGYPPFLVVSLTILLWGNLWIWKPSLCIMTSFIMTRLPSKFCISRLHYAYRGFTFLYWPNHKKTKRNDLPKTWRKPIIGAQTCYSYYPLASPSFSLTLVDGFMGLHVNIWDLFVGVHDFFVGIMAYGSLISTFFTSYHMHY